MSTEPTTSSNDAVLRTDLPFRVVRRGKVRDVYDVGGGRVLLVATDRISAFDVVMDQGVPGKGAVLTLLSAWWLTRLADLSPHHMLSVDPDEIASEVPELDGHRAQWARRAMLCVRTEPFPIECVVRGYLAGSAWKEYRSGGTLAGEALPAGLVESAELPEPLFSPATKAEEGHDENIPFSAAEAMLGGDVAAELRARSLSIYGAGRTAAEDAGILIADTKLEFGRGADGEILLIDEVLTPDSSRFWPAESYQAGGAQPSLDKQPVRDWLEARVQEGVWDRQPPPPALPDEVVEATSARYRDVFHRLTGFAPEEFPTSDPGAAPPGEGAG